jgi:hypothetical protein
VEGRRRQGLSRARRGKAIGACASGHHGEHDAHDGAAKGGRERAGVVAILAVRVRQGFDHGDGDGARAAKAACLDVY